MARSDSRVWAACAGRVAPSLLGGRLHRIVESQEQIATRKLVDGDLAAQALLEDLVEGSKPRRPPGTERLHYLLATPWRYPPLRHGSRFGSRGEPSLFYGGGGVSTMLAEAAFYRLVFLLDMTDPPDALRSQHTSFAARYRTEHGLRLQNPPFDAFADTLAHRDDYAEPQALGRALRAAGVEAFEFRSRRRAQRRAGLAARARLARTDRSGRMVRHDDEHGRPGARAPRHASARQRRGSSRRTIPHVPGVSRTPVSVARG